jgi:23S rRNA (cytosine1962-C5)-methyltransferase
MNGRRARPGEIAYPSRAVLSVVVPDRLTRHVAAGHPWLYADALPEISGARTGDVVTLLAASSSGRRPIGSALYDGDSPIRLRVLSTGKGERGGPELWRRRVETAWLLRQATLDLRDTDAFRLLHGEGDRLPGVVVDIYAGHAVLKLDTAAWSPHLPALTDALLAVARPRSIYFKGISGQKGISGEGERGRLLAGDEPPPLIEIREHGMRMQVDVRRGQKTGMFLDQRENRRLVRQVARGRAALNLFSYNGGFSLAAALGGATRVVSVDIARAAVEAARDNFVLNGLDPAPHGFVAADAFEYLAGGDEPFDLVVTDPPSFAPNAKSVRAAEAAYARLNAAAARRVRPGGLLAAASCSSHVSMDMFLQTLRESARQARRTLRLLEVRGEPPDHPTPLHFPEGRYLKFVLTVVE